jgi:ACT domain-containing protein
MTKEVFEQIIKDQLNLKDLSNNTLIQYMDVLSQDFDETKQRIIDTTIYLDKIEGMYNNILKIYQERVNER